MLLEKLNLKKFFPPPDKMDAPELAAENDRLKSQAAGLEARLNDALVEIERLRADRKNVLFERALSLVMDEWGKTRDEAMAWLEDDESDWTP
jgi:hypothetical protein